MLKEDGALPDAYKPHMLQEEYAGFMEAHIEDDWLIVWKQNDKQLTILMTGTGTHKDLFG